jgi:hypothetical protein
MGLAVVAWIVGPADSVFVEAVAVAVFVEALVGCVPNVTKETF